MAVTVSFNGAINNPRTTTYRQQQKQQEAKAYMETKWIRRRPNILSRNTTKLPKKFPIFISTDPTHTDPQDLKHLFTACNNSYHRFPNTDSYGRRLLLCREDEQEFDTEKLRVALLHSAVVVSVFCNNRDLVVVDAEEKKRRRKNLNVFEELLMKVTGDDDDDVKKNVASDGRLVGFGRAISDYGLTASIHDVMVNPSMQGMGIGTMIVKKIIRILTNSDIYDISALCSEKERFFFKACGFRENDILGSTTMMYTRSIPGCTDGDPMVKRSGRRLLLIPPVRECSAPSKTIESYRGMEDISTN